MGLPGHLLQADLTSLQARHFCRLAQSNGTQAWQHVAGNDLRPLLTFSAQHMRGFAEQATQEKPGKSEKAANAVNKPAAQGPMSHMRSGMIKAVFISPNVLMEPYRGPGLRVPFLQSWFTLPGWRARKERTMSNIKSMYAIAKLKKNIKGFGLRKFKEEALHVYEETCQLLAEGDQSRLRQATTPALFGDMKREIKARQDGGWKSVRWSMVKRPNLGQLDILHGRIMAQNPKDDKTAWVQLTVKIPSEQSFAAYSAKKSLVAGNPDKAIKVEDTWVFERALKKDPTTRWRCAGRLSIQPPPTDTKLTAATGSPSSQPNSAKRQIVVTPKAAQPRHKQRIQAAAAVM
ncbi:hypothetical protein WJX77_000889 [Trebouxia sp. C0004]